MHKTLCDAPIEMFERRELEREGGEWEGDRLTAGARNRHEGRCLCGYLGEGGPLHHAHGDANGEWASPGDRLLHRRWGKEIRRKEELIKGPYYTGMSSDAIDVAHPHSSLL